MPKLNSFSCREWISKFLIHVLNPPSVTATVIAAAITNRHIITHPRRPPRGRRSPETIGAREVETEILLTSVRTRKAENTTRKGSETARAVTEIALSDRANIVLLRTVTGGTRGITRTSKGTTIGEELARKVQESGCSGGIKPSLLRHVVRLERLIGVSWVSPPRAVGRLSWLVS